jgi:hypothetical protein
MNARLYDPVIGRFLSPDPFIQSSDFTQNFNRYSYALNNPLKYTDPSGEKWWHWVLGVGALFDPASVLVSAFTTMPVAAGTATTIAGTTYATTIANTPLLFFGGAIDKDWARGRQLVSQSWKINNGMFYTNSNENFWGQMQQLTSRFSWEGLQTIGGYNYTQFRNGIGDIDRVDFFDGATYATRENDPRNERGMSLSNYINMRINNSISGDFDNWVLNHPMYMHEYGHMIDSRRNWGPSYLFAIGIPSLFSAKNNELIVKTDATGKNLNPSKLWTHDVFWPEIRANKKAESYFSRYYGVSWTYPRYPLTNPFK